MVKNLKIGADPELFLADGIKIISAEGLIGGTKTNPKNISKNGHAIQEDNVMIEFNIPPCNNSNDFVNEINFVKDYLTQLVKLYDYNLNFSASAYLDDKFLNTPQAMEFGCDPDLNVYLKKINTAPEPGGNLRTCGGHIHIGYDNSTQTTNEMIVYAMDIMLGLESLILDKDTERRKMYGNAGCFRFKDYGVEYRTLSNFWIKDDKLITWAFNQTIKAVELATSNSIYTLVDEYGEQIKNAIDKNDKENGTELLKKIKKKLNKIICVE